MIHHTEEITRDDYLNLLSLAEVKEWAKIQYAVEDLLIGDLIVGCIRTLERLTNRDMVARLRTVTFDADELTIGEIELKGDNIQIALVQEQKNGEWIELETNFFAYTGSYPTCVQLNRRRWSTAAHTHTYRIVYHTGIELLPSEMFMEDMKAALKIMVTTILNTGRESVSSTNLYPVPLNARQMIQSYIHY